MKGKHITLPTLQIAAAAFLLMTCQAASIGANSQAVDNNNLDARNPEPDFSLAQNQPDGTISAEIPVQDNAKMARSDHVSGGFGRRQEGDPDAAAASSTPGSNGGGTNVDIDAGNGNHSKGG